METKLRQLYALQLIDNSLDELEELKGDLPAEVQVLEEKVEELEARIARLESEMKEAFAHRDLTDTDILSLKANVEKYQVQQYQVRNNKEYDALTREMDHAAERIARLEKEMTEFERKATIARTELESTRPELEETRKTLVEKQAELEEVAKENEAEELKLKHEREKTVVRLEPNDRETYERIRGAKNGKAVVPIARNACGGCFVTIPPQKLLELRHNTKFFTCERCGRILVSDEIAGIPESK